MYRYEVDNTVTYTLDDLVLFRESPFAVWMERLTLENPDHGIPPDENSIAPCDLPQRQDEIIATLRAEGRNVTLIDWEEDEPGRRAATLAAMRDGADFIINGQLAVGTLSGSASLLMRTSGYSELGDYLYIPCDTRARNIFQAAFRLACVSELLHNLQGQLPPQMLIIRDGAEVEPLQTEDYIYYYRAVQQRFEAAMQSFRKHRMPDPAESSHFGRWSECASEVLKQRALSEQQQSEEQLAQGAQVEELEMPQLRTASGLGALQSNYDVDDRGQQGCAISPDSIHSTVLESRAAPRSDSSHTLAEQARLLAPGSFRNGAAPGHTPNLAHSGQPRAVAAVPVDLVAHPNRRSSDAALQDLEFIGSNRAESLVDFDLATQPAEGLRPAPAPNLREPPSREDQAIDQLVTSAPVGLPDLEPRAPVFLPPKGEDIEALSSAGIGKSVKQIREIAERLKPSTLGSARVHVRADSAIDMDGSPAPALTTAVQKDEAELEHALGSKQLFRNADSIRPNTQPEEKTLANSPFSNSLITSRDFSDS